MMREDTTKDNRNFHQCGKKITIFLSCVHCFIEGRVRGAMIKACKYKEVFKIV